MRQQTTVLKPYIPILGTISQNGSSLLTQPLASIQGL